MAFVNQQIRINAKYFTLKMK